MRASALSPRIRIRSAEPGVEVRRPPKTSRIPGVERTPPGGAHAGWTAHSYRELAGFMGERGIDPSVPNPLAVLKANELARAIEIDPRVRPVEMHRAVARAERAMHLAPERQTDLFAFSRLIDAKLVLDEKTINALAARVDETALIRAIDQGPGGPGGGEAVWMSPKSPVELVASIVRHLVLGSGASIELRLGEPLAAWLEQALKDAGVELKQAMGGAGGFCANLASSLPLVTSHFHSKEDLPERMAERFSRSVRALDAEGRPVPLSARTTREGHPRVNYAADHGAGAFTVLGRCALSIDGKEHALEIGAPGRLIFGTPGHQAASFAGLSSEALAKIAKGHDLLFLVGAHYHTLAEDGADSAALARELDTMRAANPDLLVHLEYVVPKVAENEARVLALLKGRFDSIALNSVEAPALLGRLSRAGMTAWSGDPRPKRDQAEKIASVLDGAVQVKAALSLDRVHIHGSLGDLVVADGVTGSAERQVLALLRARQLASMKAANESGEIKMPADIWPLAPVVEGQGLAAVHAFADALCARFPEIDARVKKAIVERWWYRSEGGTLYVFVPSRGIHDRTGGMISLGDTIDATAIIFGLEPSRSRARPRPLMHPSSFA